MRRVRLLAFVCASGVLSGCTDDFEALVGPSDAALAGDAVGEGGADAGDAGDAGSYLCATNGTSVARCSECAGAPALCAPSRTCVASCNLACDAGPIACVTCSGTTVDAVCSPDLSPSTSCAPSGCACGDAGACPLDVEICSGGACRTCGDVGTHDQICKGGTGGRKCKDATEPNPDNRYTCR